MMGSLKFQAPRIFDGYRFRENVVLVTDAEGRVEALVDAVDAGDNVQLHDGIITPGFVNCHCHLELSHMRGVIPRLSGMVDFVLAVIRERNVPDDIIQKSIQTAEQEMLENGIVAVGDICNTALTVQQKSTKRLHYRNFVEVSGVLPSIAQSRFEAAKKICQELQTVAPSAIVPHAPYSVSEELWDLVVGDGNHSILSVHNQESVEEQDWFQFRTGDMERLYQQLDIDVSFMRAREKSSLQHLLPRFQQGQQLLLVHNVYTDKTDIQFSKTVPIADSLFWCLCPRANAYIGGVLPNVSLLRDEECRIVLGTDSLASNDRLSILSEINLIRENFPLIPVAEMLTWATRNGADALGMPDLGRFEKGCRPGVLLLDDALSSVKRLA